MKFRQRPVEIEAMQLIGLNEVFDSVYSWVRGHVGSFSPLDEEFPESGVSISPKSGLMLLATFDGVMFVQPGDWVVRNAHGEFYPVKPEIFEQLYEPVETDTVEEVLEFIEEATPGWPLINDLDHENRGVLTSDPYHYCAVCNQECRMDSPCNCCAKEAKRIVSQVLKENPENG